MIEDLERTIEDLKLTVEVSMTSIQCEGAHGADRVCFVYRYTLASPWP